MKIASLLTAGLAALALAGPARAEGWSSRHAEALVGIDARIELAAEAAEERELRRKRPEVREERREVREERRERLREDDGDEEHFGVGYERRREIHELRRRGR